MSDAQAVIIAIAFLFVGSYVVLSIQEWANRSIIGDIVYGLILLTGLALPLIYFFFIR